MRLLRNTPLLSTVLAVSLLTIGASAQGAAPTNLPNLSSATQTNGKSSADTAKSTPAANTGANTGTNTGGKISITGGGVKGTNTAPPTITGLGSSAAGTNAGGLPSLPTNLPTLTGVGVIVTPIVPDTAQAPFMQQSSLPDGTVFIVVGAILGFMAMSVLLWRGLVAWSLHRSVKRASLAQNTAMADTKAHFRTPGPPPSQFYKYSDRDSTISLGPIGHKGGKKGHRTASAGVGAGTSTSNLFFSPTAGAATAGLANPGNRGSNYLPAGYYAAGAAQAAGGNSHVALGHHQQPSIHLSNLPQSQGYGRPTPPDSPAYNSERGVGMQSSSTLDLNRGYGQERAPSAYLDNLFDGENGPPIPGHNSNQRGR